MDTNSFEDFKEQIRQWIKLDYIVPEDIPAIELYMDQVTTFMDKQLSSTNRGDNDTTLTKTMINNYTKNHLLPPPEKKKYSKQHIILLIYIYYLKNFLSISDIQVLLKPMIDDCFEVMEPDGISLEKIYSDIFSLEQEHYYNIKDSIYKTFDLTQTKFNSETIGNKTYLENFAFISLLSYDIYLKKQLIESMIDNLYSHETAKNAPKDSSKNSKENAKKTPDSNDKKQKKNQ